MRPAQTHGSARSVAIARSHAEELGTHIGPRADPAGGSSWRHRREPLRRPNFRRRSWLRALAAPGPVPLRFQGLRHTHASVLIEQGEHPKSVPKRLGRSVQGSLLDRLESVPRFLPRLLVLLDALVRFAVRQLLDRFGHMLERLVDLLLVAAAGNGHIDSCPGHGSGELN